MRELVIIALTISLLCSHHEVKGLEDLAVQKQQEVLRQRAGARALNSIIGDMCDQRELDLKLIEAQKMMLLGRCD